MCQDQNSEVRLLGRVTAILKGQGLGEGGYRAAMDLFFSNKAPDDGRGEDGECFLQSVAFALVQHRLPHDRIAAQNAILLSLIERTQEAGPEIQRLDLVGRREVRLQPLQGAATLA